MAFIKKTEGINTVVRKSFVCTCDSDEHQFNFRYFKEDCVDGLMYCTVHLSPSRSIFKRCWLALKYVLGYRSKYGDYAEIILDREKVKELREVLESFEKIQEF